MQDSSNSWEVWLNKQWQNVYHGSLKKYINKHAWYERIDNLLGYLMSDPKGSPRVLGTLESLEEIETPSLGINEFKKLMKCLEIVIYQQSHIALPPYNLVQRIVNFALKVLNLMQKQDREGDEYWQKRDRERDREDDEHWYIHTPNTFHAEYARIFMLYIDDLLHEYGEANLLTLIKQIIEAGRIKYGNEYEYNLHHYIVQHTEATGVRTNLRLITWAMIHGGEAIFKYLQGMGARLINPDQKSVQSLDVKISPVRYLCESIACTYEYGQYSQMLNMLDRIRYIVDCSISLDEAIEFFTYRNPPNTPNDSKAALPPAAAAQGLELTDYVSYPVRLRAIADGPFDRKYTEQRAEAYYSYTSGPTPALAWTALADSYMALRDYPRAASHYAHALQISPGYHPAQTRLNLLSQLQTNVKALQFIGRHIRVNREIDIPCYIEMTPWLSNAFFNTVIDAKFNQVAEIVGNNDCAFVIMEFDGSYSKICRDRKYNELLKNQSAPLPA